MCLLMLVCIAGVVYGDRVGEGGAGCTAVAVIGIDCGVGRAGVC